VLDTLGHAARRSTTKPVHRHLNPS